MISFYYNPISFLGSGTLMQAYRNHCIKSMFLNIQQSVNMINVEESDDEKEILVSYQFVDNVLSSIRVWERNHGELFPSRNASYLIPPELFNDEREHELYYHDGVIRESFGSTVIESNQWGVVKDHYNGTPGYRDEQDTEYTYDSNGKILKIMSFDLYPRKSMCGESIYEYNEKGDVIHYKTRGDFGGEDISLRYVKYDSHGNWIHRVAIRGVGTPPFHAWREIIYSENRMRIEQINRWIEGIPPSPSIDDSPIDEKNIIEPIGCEENDRLIGVQRNTLSPESNDSELPF